MRPLYRDGVVVVLRGLAGLVAHLRPGKPPVPPRPVASGAAADYRRLYPLFRHPDRESLAAGHKVLARMGAENARRVKSRLEAIGREFLSTPARPRER